MMKKAALPLTALALAALLLSAGCTTAVTSVSGPAPDTITAPGTGTGSSAPDQARMSFSASFRAADRVSALNGASKIATAVIAAVKAAGADDKDIRTTQISVNEQRDLTGNKVVGFEAVESLEVTTKKLDTVGAIIAAATTAGATGVSGPDFSLSDTNSARLDAIANAMADAKERAQAMAKASGRSLGGVVSISESDTGVSPFTPFSSSLKAAGAPPVAPGQLETQVQLTVVFALQ